MLRGGSWSDPRDRDWRAPPELPSIAPRKGCASFAGTGTWVPNQNAVMAVTSTVRGSYQAAGDRRVGAIQDLAPVVRAGVARSPGRPIGGSAKNGRSSSHCDIGGRYRRLQCLDGCGRGRHAGIAEGTSSRRASNGDGILRADRRYRRRWNPGGVCERAQRGKVRRRDPGRDAGAQRVGRPEPAHAVPDRDQPGRCPL